MKNLIRSAAVILLSVSLLLSGCGGKKDQSASVKQKPYTYVAEYEKLDVDYLPSNMMVFDDDKVYFISSQYNESEGQLQNELYTIHTADNKTDKAAIALDENSNLMALAKAPDGSLKALMMTYIYEGETDVKTQEEVEETTPGEEDTAGTADQGEETEDTEGGTADQGEETEDTGGTVVISEGGSSTGFRGMSMVGTTSASSVGLIGAQGEDSVITETKYEIYTLSTDGTLTLVADISEMLKASDMGASGMVIDQEGNYYFAMGQTLLALKPDASADYQIESDNWIDNLFMAGNGTLMASYYGQEGMEIHPVDTQTKAFGEADSRLMPEKYGSYRVGSGGESDVLFCQDNKVFSYKFGDESPEELFTWLDCDIDYNMINAFAQLGDGRIMAFVSGSGEEGKTEIAYLTKKKSSEVAEKKIMTLGTMYLSDNIRKMVIDFNKKNQEFRIEVTTYANYDMDYDTAIQAVNSAIIGGNCPDIMNISGLPYKSYAVKGIFEDLNPYFEKDTEIKKEDYIENVMNIYQMEDKLYAIFPTFLVNTVVGSSKVLGERTSITVDELTKLAKELPEGKELYGYATKESVLREALMMNMDNYIDWGTGECRFNSEEFIKTLEYANLFDAEFKSDESDISTEEKVREGNLLMVNLLVSSVQDYQAYEAFFDGNISFVGYPTNSENGSYIGAYDDVLAINAKSNHKDAAWSFVKGYLSEDFQMGEDYRFWGFPIMKKALEAQFDEDMKEEYFEDVDGTKERQSKTGWMMGSISLEIYAANQEQVDTVRKLIESVTTSDQSDSRLFNIIMEEAAPFFDGKKSAKDAADIIQSRIQIYVSENR